MLKTLNLLPLLLMAASVAVSQNRAGSWERVYTGTESFIEIDASSLTFTASGINKAVSFAAVRTGRVRFRTIYSKSQLVDKVSGTTYKSSLEAYEFRCASDSGIIVQERNMTPLKPIEYRLFDSKLLSSERQVVRTYDTPSDWKPIKSGNVMDKLGQAVCRLIQEKKTTP